jgi:hypothetical protein
MEKGRVCARPITANSTPKPINDFRITHVSNHLRETKRCLGLLDALRAVGIRDIFEFE